MNEKNKLFGNNVSVYNFALLENKKVLVLGIAGGRDVVGVFGISRVLKDKNPSAKITYEVSVSPKTKYDGFEKISDWLYKRKTNNNLKIAKKIHHTLSLVIEMPAFDNNEQPLLIVSPKKKKVDVFKAPLNVLRTAHVIAVDGGGNLLIGGVSDTVETEFDRTRIRVLQEYSLFTYSVIGPIYGGESTMEMLKGAIKYENDNNSFLGYFDLRLFIDKHETLSLKLLKEDRTPNIIRIANNAIKDDQTRINNLITIERHRYSPILLSWLITGLVFDGINFTSKYKATIL